MEIEADFKGSFWRSHRLELGPINSYLRDQLLDGLNNSTTLQI